MADQDRQAGSRASSAEVARVLAAHRTSAPPFVVGITGAVSSGKSTLALDLTAEIEGWEDRPSVEAVSTDGFLLPNAVLDARGLTLRKGFPETYDTAALAAALAAVRSGPASFPGYSHDTYDVDPALARRIDRPGVLLIEGLGLSAVRSSLDVLVFLDVAEADLETWFVARFLGLWGAAAKDPTSFYARFSGLDRAGAADFARTVWREINLPNLRQNIAPLREAADIVVRQGPDHAIVSIVESGRLGGA